MFYSQTGLVVPVGALYAGDLQHGDRPATPEEIEADRIAKLPTPLERIRAAEAAADDRLKRAARLTALEFQFNKVKALPAAAGKTKEEIHAWCYAADADYRELYDLEQFCAAERKKMV